MLRFSSNFIAQMTLDCNLKCKYCYECHSKNKEYITFEKFKNALDTILYQRCILGRIENRVDWHFHGGEALLVPWEELKKMIEYIEERQKIFPNLTWGIQTNATLLTEEMARYFAKKNKAIGTSFDGYEVEDRMSKTQNHKFIDTLKRYHEEFGCKFGILMVFSRKNMKTWEADARSLLSFVDSIGINTLCANNSNSQDVPTADEMLQYWIKPVLNSFLTKTPLPERDVYISVSRMATEIIFNSENISSSKNGCFDRICGIYTNMTAITPDLKLHPCDKFMEDGKCISCRKEMRLNQRDFLGLQTANLAIEHYSKMFDIEDELGCDTCPANVGCAGECQSYNMSMNGKPSINQSMCKVYKYVFEFVNTHIFEILENVPLNVEKKVIGINAAFQDRANKAGYRVNYDLESSKVCVVKEED